MTRDDIIRMAEEAGVYATTSMGITRYEALPDELTKFAQLVAAHEGEQIAKMIEGKRIAVLQPLEPCSAARHDATKSCIKAIARQIRSRNT